MRNTFFAALFAFAILGTQGLAAAPAASSNELTPGTICACCRPQPARVYSIKISGEMKDAEAVKKVEDIIKAMAGVSAVTIKDNVATVTMKRRSAMTQDDVEKALKDSGFGVTSFEQADLE